MRINKKGFTLIELLAVIAILAILVVIAVPNVLNLFGESRQKAMVIDAQAVFEAAQTQWQHTQLTSPSTGVTIYKKLSTSDTGSSNLTQASISGDATYCIKISADGKVTHFSYSNGGVVIHQTGTDIKKSDIELVSTNKTAAEC